MNFSASHPNEIEILSQRVTYFTHEQPDQAALKAAIDSLAAHVKEYFVPERIGPVLGARLALPLALLPEAEGDDPVHRAAAVLLALGPDRSRNLFPDSGHFARHWATAMDRAPPVWVAWAGGEASPPAAAAAASSALVPAAPAAPLAARALGVFADEDEVVVTDGDAFLSGLGAAWDRRLDQRVPPMAHAAAAAHANAARRAAAVDTQRALHEAAPALAAHAAARAREALQQAGPEVVELCGNAAAQHTQRLAADLEARIAARLLREMDERFARLTDMLRGRDAALSRHAARAAPARAALAVDDDDDDYDVAGPPRAARGAARPARAAAAAAPVARAARAARDDAAADSDPDDADLGLDDGSEPFGDGGDDDDDFERLLAQSRFRAGAHRRAAAAACPPPGPALWEPEICLQGRQILRLWAAHGVGVDPNATATLLATWRTSVEAALPPALKAAAAAAVANAVSYLRDGSSLGASLATRLAVDLAFYAVSARHGVACGSDVAGSMRSDVIPPDMRRRIQAARRLDATGAGVMVLGDHAPSAADVDAAALRRDTEPGHPRYHTGAGRGTGRGGRGFDRGGYGRGRQPQAAQPQQRQHSQQRRQPQQQPQPQPQPQPQQPQQPHQQHNGRGNGGRGRGQA